MKRYIFRSFGKSIFDSRQYMTQIQYFALAMSEYYAKRASDFAAILSGEISSLNSQSRIGYTNEDGIGRYIEAVDLITNLYEDDAMIFDYDSATGTSGELIPATTILAEIIDSNVGAMGFSRIFKKISDMKPTAMFNSAEMVSDLRVYLGSDRFGGQVNNLLKALDGQYPDGCISQLTSNSPEPENFDEFDVSDYDGDGVNIVWAACVSIVNDITSGIAEAFSGIKKIKDIGKALAKGVTTLVTNLVNVAFANLLNDYEWNNDAVIPGIDLPFASFKWSSLQDFSGWLSGGLANMMASANHYTNCIDCRYFDHDWREEPVIIDRSLALYRFKPTNSTVRIVEAKIQQYLNAYGFFETIVYGIRLRILKTKSGSIQALLYPTGININNAAVVNGYQTTSVTTDDDVISMSSDFDQIGVDGKVTNDEMLSIVYRSNRSVNGIYQMPIFPNGWNIDTYDPIGGTYDNYSRFWGTLANASSSSIAKSIVTVNLPLTDTYEDNMEFTAQGVFQSSSCMGQNAILFILCYVFTEDLKNDLINISDVSFDSYSDTIIYSSSFDPVDNGSIIPLTGDLNAFYPYYTTVTSDTKIHLQTYNERVNEIKGAIVKVFVAAAAVAATVGFFKLKKVVRTKISQNSALLQQARAAYNPANPQTAADLAKLEKKARKLAKVGNILGVSSVGASIAMPESEDYSDDFTNINRAIVG